jgi:hypothetical protein
MSPRREAETAQGWKVLTHDWRPPVQGGDPVCDGRLPVTLPTVRLDTGRSECAPGTTGWYFSSDLATAVGIAGLWPNGRPARGLLVTPSSDAIVRGSKRRAASLTLEREATESEWEMAIRELSGRFSFGEHQERMVSEQLAWRRALARPLRDPAAVEACLRIALQARGLDWTLKQYPDAWDARSSRAVGTAWDARPRAAWAAWDARSSRAAWAAWAAWAARSSWDAGAALTVCFTSLAGLTPQYQPEQCTVGLRDAYEAGLEIAIPTGPNELGWAMAEGDAG